MLVTYSLKPGLIEVLYRTTITSDKDALTNTTTASDCQTPSGQIPWDEPEQGTGGYGGKESEKRKVLRRQWKLKNVARNVNKWSMIRAW